MEQSMCAAILNSHSQALIFFVTDHTCPNQMLEEY